jgi:hypothetical protein
LTACLSGKLYDGGFRRPSFGERPKTLGILRGGFILWLLVAERGYYFEGCHRFVLSILARSGRRTDDPQIEEMVLHNIQLKLL